MKLLLSISLLLLGAGTGLPQDHELPPALASLAAAERAFAGTSLEKGFRASFLTFFADDGIFFQPHPVKAKEALRERPATPETFTLNWEPIFGDVSDAGDLGFTTGPFTLSDKASQNSKTKHGCFFSVWKVQADGSWKVVVDAGITTPGPVSSGERTSFRAARHPHPKQTFAPANLDTERLSLTELDRELLREIGKVGIVNAFLSRFDDEGRLHRTYYVRVWRRDADRRWKLLLDTVSPVPPEEK